jgi:hypothetical protein
LGLARLPSLRQSGADVRPDFNWDKTPVKRCDDYRWVCENHLDRPWEGPRGPDTPARGGSMVESVSTQFVLNYFKERLSLISSRRGLTFNIAVRLVLLLKRIDKRSQVARAIITYKVACRLSPRCEVPEDEPGAH